MLIEPYDFPFKLKVNKNFTTESSDHSLIYLLAAYLDKYAHYGYKELFLIKELKNNILNYFEFESDDSYKKFMRNNEHSRRSPFIAIPSDIPEYLINYFNNKLIKNTNLSVKENHTQFYNKQIVFEQDIDLIIGDHISEKELKDILSKSYQNKNILGNKEIFDIETLEDIINYFQESYICEIVIENNIITDIEKRDGYHPSILMIDKVLKNLIDYSIIQFKQIKNEEFNWYLSNINSAKRLYYLWKVLINFEYYSKFYAFYCPDIYKRVYVDNNPNNIQESFFNKEKTLDFNELGLSLISILPGVGNYFITTLLHIIKRSNNITLSDFPVTFAKKSTIYRNLSIGTNKYRSASKTTELNYYKGFYKSKKPKKEVKEVKEIENSNDTPGTGETVLITSSNIFY